MRGRASALRFNFDSLTDVVTNLSGTLILIVVLVLGLTREMKPSPPPAPLPTDSRQAGKPIAPLLKQVEQLNREVRAVEEDIRQLELLLPELQQKVQKLRKDSAPQPGQGGVAAGRAGPQPSLALGANASLRRPSSAPASPGKTYPGDSSWNAF